jgi:aspartyl aminopeptidase
MKEDDINTLAQKILNSPIEHKTEYHGPKKSTWDYLKDYDKKKLEKFDKFCSAYFGSLNNKTIPQRTRYILETLENHGFRSFKALTGRTIEEFTSRDPEKNWKPGTKFYLTHKDDMVIACQLGKKAFSEGVHWGFAHIDSPHISGTGKFIQEYGVAYMIGEPYGDFNPENWESGDKKPLEFIIGDKEGEPNFIISDESSHLSDESPLKRKQIKIIMGGLPYSEEFDNSKRVLFETLRRFYNEPILNKITQQDFEKACITFFPPSKPRKIGINSSLISGFGQDDWACAFPSLWAFVKTKQPDHTSFLQLHSGEEIDDEGRAAVSGNFVSEVVAPAVAALREEDIGRHYKGLLNGISVWGDVTEAIHGSRPELHDPNDSSYLNAGVTISRHSGDEDQWQAYRPSPRIIEGFTTLFEQNKIPFQIGTMGHSEDKTSGASTKIHPALFTEGIDFSVPGIGMHKGQGEIFSPADIWFFSEAMKAFYSLENHSIFPKNHTRTKPIQRLK